MRLIRLTLLIVAAALAGAARAEPVPVADGVSYEEIGHWDVDRLNAILETDAPAFLGKTVAYSPAGTGVRLYRISYASVVPERGNRPIRATGLLAVPDAGGPSFPLLSYQHGTVYGKDEVPSQPENSPETQLMLAQFAGQGYVVIGADYFGMGGGAAEPEGYIVKGSQQQATADMLRASRAVLADLGVEATDLFLGGWSQGGFVTMALLERLEASGVPVAAAATASAPTDAAVILNGFLDFPRENDADWITALFILTSFSFETYYGVPGLARSVIADDHYAYARAIYERTSLDGIAAPSGLRDLIRADYFDPQFFAASAFGRLVSDTNAYRWVIRTPVRNYYGENDEVISVGLGRLPMTYQQAMGAGNTAVEAISTGDTDHRGTYAVAAGQWKSWFDGF